MASTSHYLILCFILAGPVFGDPAANTFMGKSFVPAAPAARPLRPGTPKLGAQPFGEVPTMSSGAEARGGLGSSGPLENMERSVARLTDENLVLKLELQQLQLRSQIEKMEGFLNQRQGGPEIVQSSLLADLRLWVCLAGAVVGAILYSIFGKSFNRHDGVATMSASLLDGAALELGVSGGVALGGRSSVPMMRAAFGGRADFPVTSMNMMDGNGSAAAAHLSTRAVPRFATCERRTSSPICAMDYKDPDVAAEMKEVQGLDPDEIEDELAQSGIIAPPSMDSFELQTMLVEMRLRKKGKFSEKPKSPPKRKSFENEFERAMFEKPAFKALYDEYRKKADQNAMNLATEHLINPVLAKEKYGGTDNYEQTIKEIEKAVTVISTKFSFAGFPAGMGEEGIQRTFAAFGEVVDLSCEESDDLMTLTGRVELDSIDAAKAAIDKWDGTDMGLGTVLELKPIA